MPKYTECPHCGECLTHHEIEEQYCHECERDLKAIRQYRLNESAQEKIEDAHEQHIEGNVGFVPPVAEAETENESEAKGMSAGASDPYEYGGRGYGHCTDSWIH